MNLSKRRMRPLIFAVIGIAAISIIFILVRNTGTQSDIPDAYMITSENHFDYQKKYECSGYSSAYVIRGLGKEADGIEVYESIPYKNADGTVEPVNLLKFLNEQGYSAKMEAGTLEQLKSEVSKGVPVIAFVKITPDLPYLHYLPIVGYDRENIYAADSLENLINSDSEHFNRCISTLDFEKMWKTYYPKSYTYITIE